MTRPQLDLVFARRFDRTVLDRRLFRWPYSLTRTFALDKAPAHMLTAIVQSSSGAVHGEDRLSQSIHVRADAAAHVTTQGASAIHRAGPGLAASESVAVRVEAGGYLEYLPEPRILFPDADLVQTLDVDCAPGAVALVGDAFTFHDPAYRGGSFRRFVSTITVRLDGGRPVMIDRMDITGGRGGTSGFAAFGSLTLVAPGRVEADRARCDELMRELAIIPDLYAAASPLPGGGAGNANESAGLGMRFAGRDLRAVRSGMRIAWTLVRCAFYGAPPGSRRKGDDVASAKSA